MGAESSRFDKTWREMCEVAHACHQDLDFMIRLHYLKCWPAIVTCKLGLWQGPFLMGACIFAYPPIEMDTRMGGQTWELARLWIDDNVPGNAETWMIGKAVKHIKLNHPEVKYLVSYADPSQGHRGTIYRAANWKFDGMTDAGRKSPRCDYVFEGKKYSRKGHLPEGAVPKRVARISKYRFIYDLKGKQC